VDEGGRGWARVEDKGVDMRGNEAMSYRRGTDYRGLARLPRRLKVDYQLA
jgi:hypothetical protein